MLVIGIIQQLCMGLMVVVLLECISLGYLYKLEDIRSYVNERSEIRVGKWWNFLIKVVTPLVIVVLLDFEIVARIKGPYEGYPRWAEFQGGWFVLGLIFAVAMLLGIAKGAKDKEEEQAQEQEGV